MAQNDQKRGKPPIFESFRDRKWTYTCRMAFILYQLAQNSFPTDPENMNPIRQLFLVEKSIFSIHQKSLNPYVYSLSDFNRFIFDRVFEELKNRFFDEK